uniref:Uncharacterized protein n=1 Tax=Anguilla anguilla TaxID=7936 RepID=A0A0E9TGJ5_ANGAN
MPQDLSRWHLHSWQVPSQVLRCFAFVKAISCPSHPNEKQQRLSSGSYKSPFL